jgi:hypothetical protein
LSITTINFGIIGLQGLHQLSGLRYLSGMPYIAINAKICDEGILRKQHKENAPKKNVMKASQQNELIDTNICDPF